MAGCRKVVYTTNIDQSDCQLTTPPVYTNWPILPRIIIQDKRELIPVVTPPAQRYDTGSRGKDKSQIVTQGAGTARGVLYRTPKPNEMYMDMLDNV